MEPTLDPLPADRSPDAAGAWLDALRDHPDWTDHQREHHLYLLVARFEPADLSQAVLERLHDLSGPRGEAMLRVIEALGEPELFEALADALSNQTELTPERTWEALGLLEATGLIEARPDLDARRAELCELIDDDDATLDALIDQLESDPESLYLALQGLATIEPEVRAEIIAGLGRTPIGPGQAEFLRLLAFAHDPLTRSKALDALAFRTVDGHDPHRVAAWSDLATHHPDPGVRQRASQRVPRHQSLSTSGRTLALARAVPPVASLVTDLDGRGQGSIVLVTENPDGWASASFWCDVERGVLDVVGQLGQSRADVEGLLFDTEHQADRDSLRDAHDLALGLLSGSMLLCGPETTPALRYWIEQTLGSTFRPRPFTGLIDTDDPSTLPFEEMPARAQAVLDACPNWVDDSPLTFQLAGEILLRSGPPDPQRDAGAYRFLFEHRLQSRLELYQRMLSWMAGFWRAVGDTELSRSAHALAFQLSDPQHAVPRHPFTVALTSASLLRAQQAIPPASR